METKFKLKKEARQFFNKDLHDDISVLEYWEKKGIHKNLLEEVPLVHITYGHHDYYNNQIKSSSLSGWSKEHSDFKFTIVLPELSNEDYHLVEIPRLMDEMQTVINSHFKQY